MLFGFPFLPSPIVFSLRERFHISVCPSLRLVLLSHNFHTGATTLGSLWTCRVSPTWELHQGVLKVNSSILEFSWVRLEKSAKVHKEGSVCLGPARSWEGGPVECAPQPPPALPAPGCFTSPQRSSCLGSRGKRTGLKDAADTGLSDSTLPCLLGQNTASPVPFPSHITGVMNVSSFFSKVLINPQEGPGWLRELFPQLLKEQND